MKYGYLLYKCRQCRQQFRGLRLENIAPIFRAIITQTSSFAWMMNEQHDHLESQTVGWGDIVGFEEETDEESK